MNCLQMVQMLQAQIGTSADLPWAGPTTLLGVTGQYLELFNWIQMAYQDIQIDQEDWRWRVKQSTLALTTSQAAYSLADITAQITDWERIVPLHFVDDQRYVLVYDPAIGVADQAFCFYILYQDFRGWKDRQVPPSGKPAYYTILDDDSLQFNPVPDKVYNVTLDYMTALDAFPSSSNQPTSATDAYSPLYLPSRYHRAIVMKALMYWAEQRENASKYQTAKIEYDRVMAKLYAEYLPNMQFYVMEFYGR